MSHAVSRKMSVIHAALRRQIVEGEWVAGLRLPTDVELAGQFGCSPGTINKAMNFLAHEGLVSRKTRTGTIVLRSGPEPAAAPSALDALAFICPTDLHEAIRRVMHGFQDAAREARRRTLVLTTGLDLKKEGEIIGRLAEFDVKGAVIFPVLQDPQQRIQFSQMILACPFPVVLVQALLPDLKRSSVHVDSLHAGSAMTRYLLGQGLRRIGFLANYAAAPLVREKHAGYRQVMLEAGLEAECVRYSRLQSDMKLDLNDPLAESRAISQAYLEECPDVEAVVCAGDFLALGMIETAPKMGRSVPGDLKVAGLDDLARSQSAPVPLTAYRAPFEEVGRKAYEVLQRNAAAGRDDGEEIQLRGEIVARASTGGESL